MSVTEISSKYDVTLINHIQPAAQIDSDHEQYSLCVGVCFMGPFFPDASFIYSRTERIHVALSEHNHRIEIYSNYSFLFVCLFAFFFIIEVYLIGRHGWIRNNWMAYVRYSPLVAYLAHIHLRFWTNWWGIHILYLFTIGISNSYITSLLLTIIQYTYIASHRKRYWCTFSWRQYVFAAFWLEKYLPLHTCIGV